MRFATACLLLVLLAMASGCTSTAPYWRACDIAASSGAACRESSVERTQDFPVAYVELSDQGLFHDRKQMSAALDLLRGEGEQVLEIVLFVHGWKHSAKFADSDVVNFRDVVLRHLPRKRPGTRVVGIYVGWRGAVLAGPAALQNITFYDRKSAADHVARGSLRELLAHLRDIRERAHAAPGRKVRLTLIGHSFGGLILYNSVAESLFGSVVAASHGDAGSPRLAVPIADLVLLLNPAFEASRFEPLFQAAKERLAPRAGAPRPYSQKQRPLLVSITSEADLATRTAFPAGRWVNTLLQHEGWTSEDEGHTADYSDRIEKIANTHTIGHLERYRTHRLESSGGGQSAAGSEPIDCAALPNSLVLDANRFPLWNLYASEQVIDAHHDIYRPNLWALVRQLSDPDIGLDEVCRKKP